ncbi:hypothetical protein [Ectobacillus panaciterrae]|uniref:hypothetical protein n=1 Tax=Ectobacillus panaciterrae TaxID=363872 RepID=UPI000417A383|nr:hypothetical protein [Ectobacillus panaciterrae]
MSSHTEFLAERDKIDFLIQKGYLIANIRETLDGAFVDFEKQGEAEEPQTLHIMTADARKYFSALLIKQMSSVS